MRIWSIRALTLTLVGTAFVPFAFGQRTLIGPPPVGGNVVTKPSRIQKFNPRPYTVLVAYKSATDSKVAAIEKQLGIYEDKTCRSPYFKRYFISHAAQLNGVTVDSAIRFLQAQSVVRLAEPDMPVFPDQVNDPSYGVQWGLHNTGQSGGTVDADVDAPEAWALIPSMTNVMVAVLDDAIEINHADLAANIAVHTGEIASNGIDDDGNGFIDDVKGWDFVDGDNNPTPPTTSSSHGTHVAGLLAEVSNNATGAASASRNVKILPVRFYDGQSGWMSDLILGIDYSRQRGVKAVSISYNLDGWTQLLADAFVRLKNADIVAMCSAGNNSQQNPARLGMLSQAPNICFVASSNRFDQLSSFSNYGLQVAVTAPGEDVYATLPFGTYGNNSGTSMSTPFAAGILGTIRSLYPSMTYSQAISRLTLTSDRKPQFTGKLTAGRVNMLNAIESDTLGPSTPGTPTLLRRSTGTYLVTFTASGDDGLAGAASAYDVRYSTAPINAGNFASATPISFQTPTATGGTLLKTSIGGLSPNTSYYVAIRAMDNVGNESGIASIGPVSTLPAPLFEQMEGVSSPFTGTSTWARTSSAASSPTQSWTDSPAGNYVDNANNTLTYTGSVNVTQPMNLAYRMRYDLESGYDFLAVDISTNGGSTWTQASSVTGTSGGNFTGFSVPLNGYVGQTIKFRFHLTTDTSITRDGVYIDDVAVVPLVTTFSDNVEGANQFSGAGSTWVVSTEMASSPTRAWNDGPGVNYGNNTNQMLNGITNLDAEASGSPLVSFKANVNTESGYDFLNVRSSVDGGATWATRASYTGNSGGFVSLSSPLGVLGTARVGFQLTSDGSDVASGIAVDDIAIVGEPWVQTLAGNVNLNGFAGTKGFTVKLQTGATVHETHNVSMTGVNGSFSVNTSLFGVYDVVIEGPSFLRRVIPGVNITALTNVTTALVNGNINGDGFIGTADYNALRAVWGLTSSSSGWNPNADLDGNGFIGTGDYNILRANWGAVGN